VTKKATIPVHKMDDWHAGVYLKSFGKVKAFGPSYEMSVAHRHDFYYLVLLDEGRLELEVDFQRVRLDHRSLFLSYPGQVHRILSASLKKGWFLAFDPTIIDQPLRDALDQCLSEVIAIPLLAEKSADLTGFAAYINEVYGKPNERFYSNIIHSMLTALVYQVVATYLSGEQAEFKNHSVRNMEITKTFKQILRQNYKSIKRPSFFAAKMNISIGHLNDTISSVTGFPVTYFIQQETIREAQRLLRYSDLSIKEIAQSVGFDDAQYFSRLFSKVTGDAPGAFRNRKD
jgi:AraC family transcriptional activator of pobA